MRILIVAFVSVLLMPLAQGQALAIENVSHPEALEPGTGAPFEVGLGFICPNVAYANPGGWTVRLDLQVHEGVVIEAYEDIAVPQDVCLGDGHHDLTAVGVVNLNTNVTPELQLPVKLTYAILAEGDLPTANSGGKATVAFSVHAPGEVPQVAPADVEEPVELEAPAPTLPLLALAALAAAAVRRRA